MSYQKQNIMPVLEVKEWFDKAAKEYRQYWSLLDSVDNNRFLRFLPRNLQHSTILDIGAGDGRVFEHFKNTWYHNYIAVDISQKMLDRFQSSAVIKCCADVEESIPLWDATIDLALAFFVIEYIADLHYFFMELSRVLKPWATCVASYFFQRHAFVFGHADDSFKIERFPHTYEDIQAAAEYSFLHVDAGAVTDQGKVIWYIYEFKKD